jgi:DNA replication protein DnaC
LSAPPAGTPKAQKGSLMPESKTIEQVIADGVAKLEEIRNRPPPAKATDADVAARAARMVELGYLPVLPTVFRRLAAYLAAPNEARKGLLLYGDAGTGKTLFLTAMFKPQQFPSASEVVDAFRENEGDWRRTWFVLCRTSESKPRNECPLFIDDLGTEPAGVYFGERRDVIAEAIAARWNDWTANRARTYLTANLTLREIEQRYGRRVTDRLADMCEFVEFKGESQRGIR